MNELKLRVMIALLLSVPSLPVTATESIKPVQAASEYEYPLFPLSPWTIRPMVFPLS
jgi:hypothetical protein